MTEPRVRTKFDRRFTTDSSAGKVFDWLREEYGSGATDQIVMAVKILFLPQALAESGESEENVNLAMKKSRRIFEERMRFALDPFFKPEEHSESRNGNAHVLGILPSKTGLVKGTLHASPAAQGSAQPLKDDDFELDESKLFDN